MIDHTTRPDPRALMFEDGADLPDDVEVCAYCGTPFTPTDLCWLSPQATHDAPPIRVARCAACTAVHSQGTCGRCNTDAYHPTIDNTPWGEQGCRKCSMPDPFTHLLGFISTVIARHRDLTPQLESLQRHNQEVAAINAAVHADLARVLALFSDHELPCGTVAQAVILFNHMRVRETRKDELLRTVRDDVREVHVNNGWGNVRLAGFAARLTELLS